MKVFCIDQLKYWLRRDVITGTQAALLLSDLLPEFADFENDDHATGHLIRCCTICLWPDQSNVHMIANREIYQKSLIRLERSVAEKIDLMRQCFEEGERRVESLEQWLNWAIDKNLKINWLPYALAEGFFPYIKIRVEGNELTKRRYLASPDSCSLNFPLSNQPAPDHKPYEVYGIPENIWLEYEEPPEHAIIYDEDDYDKTFSNSNRLIPNHIKIWGCANYWTAPEAALLMAGVSPSDPHLYVVVRNFVEDIGYGTSYYAWKNAYQFDHAKDYLFLCERSDLAPKARPIEWIKQFRKKIQICDDWINFFSSELNEADQQEASSDGIDNATPRRREQQHEMILAVIAALQYEPQQIPYGGKAKIKKACLTRPKLFTSDSFDHAWKAGSTAGLFKLTDHDKYSQS